MGQALYDFHTQQDPGELFFESDISERDVYPLDYFFRGFDQMPRIEQIALEHCKGSVLDIGAGAGNHSLYLQKQGFDITALDSSKEVVGICRTRGINRCICQEILSYNDRTYDTLLLLMNGIGIAGTLDKLPKFLEHLKSLLNPDGQILVDSSDLRYMYDSADNGAILVPAHMNYYGQLRCRVSYKDQISEEFDWLYLDALTFEQACKSLGLNFKVLAKGEHYDYLAQITVS